MQPATISNEGVQFENLSRMNGGEDDNGKWTEQDMSILCSSFCSSSSSNSGYASGFDMDDENYEELTPIPQVNRIPLSVFEPLFPNNEWSMISDAPPYETPFEDFDDIYSSSASTPMKSPSTQLMDRPAGYDPERIPSSIFSSKPAGPCDWSLASNESLFSIHHRSFSRDEAIFMEKSEELGLIEEFSIPSSNPFSIFESKANEANRKSCSTLEPINETETLNGRHSSFCMEVDDDKETWRKPENRRDKNQSIGTDASTSVRSGMISGVEGDRTGSSITRNSGVSGESENSYNSFAFPAFANEGRKSSITAIPQAENAKETTKKSQTSWMSFSCFSCFSCFSGVSCFSCFKTWHRCCPCASCSCL